MSAQLHGYNWNYVPFPSVVQPCITILSERVVQGELQFQLVEFVGPIAANGLNPIWSKEEKAPSYL
jgi:hypothetical protein